MGRRVDFYTTGLSKRLHKLLHGLQGFRLNNQVEGMATIVVRSCCLRAKSYIMVNVSSSKRERSSLSRQTRELTA